MNHPSPLRRTRRSGFTLVEILIVIGIMALLASVVLVAVKGVTGNAKAAATKSTIRKIDSLLTKRMEAFQRVIIDQDKAKPAPSWPAYAEAARSDAAKMLPTNASDRDVRELARVLGRKKLFRNYFYQPLDRLQRDVNGKLENNVRGIDFVAAKLKSEISDVAARASFQNKASEADSAECLYYMLMKDVSAGMEAADADAFTSQEIGDTDGDGLPEFIDGWGQPLRFYRWPTRLVRPGGVVRGSANTAQSLVEGGSHDEHYYNLPIVDAYDTTTGASLRVLIGNIDATPSGVLRGTNATIEHEHQDPLARDGDDPLGLIHRVIMNDADQAGIFESNFHTPDTYHTPLVISSGPDKQFGIWAPFLNPVTNVNENDDWIGRLAQPDLSTLEAMLDNITNRNVRSGGN